MPRIVDLTLPFGPETPSPPSVDTRVKLTHYHRGPGFWQATKVEMLLHTGSHVDFARHCQPDGETAADVSLDRTCGDAVVLDVTHADANHAITVADLERASPGLRRGDIALVHTGWSDKVWGEFPTYYLESPYCTPEAARWLIGQGVKAVGFDCFSEYPARLPDFTSEDFQIHKIVLDAGAILMQQLTGLGQLPAGRRVPFFGAFPRLREAEGAPARFFALVDDEDGTTAGGGGSDAGA